MFARQTSQRGTGPAVAGRFQLFQGEYQFINAKGQEFWLKGLFRIDTTTGTVWLGEADQITDSQGGVTQTTRWRPFEQTMKVPSR
jgi:hypothetical protein